MYSSLDKLDLVYQEKGSDRRVAVQTDHRPPEEIDAEWDLSIVFAAVRARNALRGNKVQAVRFTFPHNPPQRMVTLLHQLGAEIEVVGTGTLPTSTPRDDAAVDTEVEAAFLRLGEAVFTEYDYPMDLDGLERLELGIQGDTEGGPEGEFAHQFWINAVKLGGATAVVMKDIHGGSIHADTDVVGAIPFRWAMGDTLVNIFGRAVSFLSDDPNVAPSKLVAMQTEQAGPDGDVMFNFRPRDWPGLPLALLVPLFEKADELEPHDLPLVALVTDLPTATKTFSKDTPPEEVERLREEALANLRKIDVQVQRVGGEESGLMVVHGHYYAAERLLDPEFMRGLATQLGADLLAVAVPKKGLLFVQDAGADPKRIPALHAVVRRTFDEAAPSDRLSTSVMLVREGVLVGLARLTESTPQSEPPPKKRGFWSRLFGSEDN